MRLPKPLEPFPQNIALVPDPRAVVIRRRWRTARAYFLLFFSILWNGFMVVWMSIAIAQEAWAMAAFGLLHGTIGLGLIYFSIASFVNHTDIRIDTSNLSIKHAPLPWFGQKAIPIEEVLQVHTKERIHRHKNSTSTSYELFYLDRQNREIKLLAGLTTPTQARYIESEIENTLGIHDRAVSGEHPK